MEKYHFYVLKKADSALSSLTLHDALQAVEDALNAGHERFSSRDRRDVLDAMKAVRLDPGLAKEMLTNTVRQGFMGFITRSRNKANRLEAAKELKALVYFSNLVVSPLLEDINVRLLPLNSNFKRALATDGC